ncbi:hypothetical protein Bca52824_093272 [Brassica carinata]|uniref:Uncharacterized protein n=1 Tax=Brassica carinata TaxID=52824 RepID=A0A8X7P611_BRACI|nr:hypothetical protein Bca52824_093272 [Brassica carinata]
MWCENISASTIRHHHRRVVTVHLVSSSSPQFLVSSCVISLSLCVFRSHFNFVLYKVVLAAEEDDMLDYGICGRCGARRNHVDDLKLGEEEEYL